MNLISCFNVGIHESNHTTIEESISSRPRLRLGLGHPIDEKRPKYDLPTGRKTCLCFDNTVFYDLSRIKQDNMIILNFDADCVIY